MVEMWPLKRRQFGVLVSNDLRFTIYNVRFTESQLVLHAGLEVPPGEQVTLPENPAYEVFGEDQSLILSGIMQSKAVTARASAKAPSYMWITIPIGLRIDNAAGYDSPERSGVRLD